MIQIGKPIIALDYCTYVHHYLLRALEREIVGYLRREGTGYAGTQVKYYVLRTRESGILWGLASWKFGKIDALSSVWLGPDMLLVIMASFWNSNCDLLQRTCVETKA